MIPEVQQLAEELARRQVRIVLAESCTAGLASSLLAAVPGISEFLCGSWVAYREECKQAWLGVPAKMLREKTAVSPEVTAHMAIEALRRTESAHFAAAITGHMGPNAPATLDGVSFLAIAERQQEQIQIVRQHREVLTEKTRTDRQQAAARRLLAVLTSALQSSADQSV